MYADMAERVPVKPRQATSKMVFSKVSSLITLLSFTMVCGVLAEEHTVVFLNEYVPVLLNFHTVYLTSVS